MSIGLLAALNSGCATPALWHATAPRDWTPCSLDQVLFLTETNHQQDLAVLFSQAIGTGLYTKTRTVGWRVSQPPDHLAVTPAAIRLLTNGVSDVQAIPILPFDGVTSSALDQPPHIFARSVTPGTFTLYHTDFPSQSYTLPSNRQTHYTVRTCILPIAIATDATMIFMAALASGHWK